MDHLQSKPDFLVVFSKKIQDSWECDRKEILCSRISSTSCKVFELPNSFQNLTQLFLNKSMVRKKNEHLLNIYFHNLCVSLYTSPAQEQSRLCSCYKEQRISPFLHEHMYFSFYSFSFHAFIFLQNNKTIPKLKPYMWWYIVISE